MLVAVHGLSYERTAEVCGCEVGTVKSRVNRARAQLKAILLEDAPRSRRKSFAVARLGQAARGGSRDDGRVLACPAGST